MRMKYRGKFWQCSWTEEERMTGQRCDGFDDVSNYAKLFGLSDWKAIASHRDRWIRLLEEIKTQQWVVVRGMMIMNRPALKVLSSLQVSFPLYTLHPRHGTLWYLPSFWLRCFSPNFTRREVCGYNIQIQKFCGILPQNLTSIHLH